MAMATRTWPWAPRTSPTASRPRGACTLSSVRRWPFAHGRVLRRVQPGQRAPGGRRGRGRPERRRLRGGGGRGALLRRRGDGRGTRARLPRLGGRAILLAAGGVRRPEGGATRRQPRCGSDVDGDGYGDLLVGASLHDEGQPSEGKAFLYRGSSVGVATTAAWSVQGNQTGAFLGSGLDGAGDVNGDGSPTDRGPDGHDGTLSDEGRALVYLGSARVWRRAAWTHLGGQAGARLGSSVARAGDVDGDGYGDVSWAPGCGRRPHRRGQPAPLPRLGQRAVAHARLDDRGQPDRVAARRVGGGRRRRGRRRLRRRAGRPRLYDGPEVNEGRASLYRGYAFTLGQTSAWASRPTIRSRGGHQRGLAGDVNRDGYDDVIVGARNSTTARPTRGALSAFSARPRACRPRPTGQPSRTWPTAASASRGRRGRPERRRLRRRDRRR